MFLSEAVADGLCPRCLTKSVFADDEAPPDGDRTLTERGRWIGGYELLGRIARGGMGVVYRARQPSLQRQVALKVLLDSVFASEAELARFQVEASAAAALHHPNIVAIHEVGEAQGQQFYSMDLIAGQDLATLTKERPLGIREAAGLLTKVAAAIQHAHENGVLHRDLKPSNVLVDALGEPHVTDFGLAKRFLASSDGNLTLTGQVVGTPGYMSPEQAIAQHDIGPSTDVYSLGALLYHVLTGRAPFVGETPAAVLRQVEESDPVSPNLLNPSVPRDLETICLKCLAKEPPRRYASAREVGAELDRFMKGEPIQARPVGALESAWRWSRRHPRVAALTGLSVFLFLLVISVTITAGVRFREQARAVRRKDYVADMRLVDSAVQEHNLGQAINLLDKWRPSVRNRRTFHLAREDEDLRGFEWRYFLSLCQDDELLTLGAHSDRALRVAFSRDGRRVASASTDGEVRLWDLETRELLGMGRHARRVMAMAFSPDDLLIATGADDLKVRLWNAKTLQPNGLPLEHNSAIVALAFMPGSEELSVVARQEFVRWDLQYRCAKARQPIAVPTWFYGAISPGFDTLALPMTRDQGVRLWNLPPTQERGAVGSLGVAVAFSSNNELLAEGDFRGTIRIWDQKSLRELLSIPAHSGVIQAVAWSPDGSVLASGGRDELLKTWAVPSGKPLAVYRGHQGTISGIAFSTDGSRIATASSDRTVRIWDAAHPPVSRENPVRRDFRLGYPRHGNWILLDDSLSDRDWIDPQRVERVSIPVPSELRSSNTVVRAIRKDFLVFGPGPEMRRFDQKGRSVGSVTTLPQWPMGLIVTSPDGHWLAWKTRDVEISDYFLWRMGSSTKPVPFGAAGTVWLMPTFSPNSRQMVAVNLEGELGVWDLERATLVHRFRGLHSVATGLQFSGDGRWLAVSAEEGLIRVWNTRAWSQVPMVFNGGHEAIWCVDIAPDNRRIAGGGDNGSVFLWDVETGQIVARLKTGESNLVQFVAFSVTGNELLAVVSNAICVLEAPVVPDSIEAPLE